jgi:hypothetical protein
MWQKVATAHANVGSRWVISSIVWLAVVGIGFKMLLDYENAPARAHANPTEWPSDSKLRLAQHGATLVLFAHPH